MLRIKKHEEKKNIFVFFSLFLLVGNVLQLYCCHMYLHHTLIYKLEKLAIKDNFMANVNYITLKCERKKCYSTEDYGY